MERNEPKRSFLEKIDIFAFTPVPKGSNYSSKRSRYATIAFVGLFCAYFGYTMYCFFDQNVPRINQFNNRLDDTMVYPAPDMAFAFVQGDNLNMSFYNTSYFTFTFQQVVVNSNPTIPRNYTNINLTVCRPDWLNPVFDCFCPTQSTSLQGLLYGSPLNMYPRLKMTLCNNATTNNGCATTTAIQWTLMTGRLFVFIKQYDSYDYLTGQNITDDTPFTSYYYFVVMGQYNRAEVKIQVENVTINPTLLTTFENQYMERLSLADQNFYVSQVPDPNSVFLWWCSMQDVNVVTTVGYQTILDVMSDVGAMWGLLFAIFAFYFLSFNQNRYYTEKPHMVNFDEKITPLVVSSEARSRNQSMASQKNQNEDSFAALDRSARQTLDHSFLQTLVKE